MFYGNKIAVQIDKAVSGTLTHRNNALFGNRSDYVGAVGAGMGDLSQDPLLDKLQIPWAPLPNSPLRCAADQPVAPAADCFRRPRVPRAGIGCVQVVGGNPP